jgi:hypothetical protein
VLRLPIGKGSESDPSRRNKGSSARTIDSGPEREALIEEAIGLFSPRYGRAITRVEARQMLERLTAFFGGSVPVARIDPLPAISVSS